MNRYISSKHFSSAWKLAFALAFLLSQGGWIPGAVGQVQAAPGKPAPAFALTKPSVVLDIPADALIGEDVPFSVTFDNPGTTASDTGYSPFVDVAIDSTGADGNDGLGTILSSITASTMGRAIPSSDLFVVPFVAGVAPTDPPIMAVHPFLLDSNGHKVNVAAPAGFDIGDLLVVAKLPFGSFAPDQPKVEVDFKVNLSNLADLGTALNVAARGGYEFGFTPQDDWCCGDAAWPAAVSDWTSGSVTPSLFTLCKTYLGPDDATATGPNFLQQYKVTAKVAPGQTVTNLDLTDVLPNTLQFVSLASTTVNGVAVAPDLISTPSTSTPGGTLTNRFASVTVKAEMVFNFYVPLNNTAPAPVIDPVTGSDALSCNNISITGGMWTPIDVRDTVANFATTPYDPVGCEHTLTTKSIAIQKSMAVLSNGTVKPGTVLEYTLSFQVSDFFAFDSLSVTDLLSDGQHVLSTFTPTLQINGNGYTLATAAIGAANYDISCNYTGGPGPECTTNDPAADNGTTKLVFRVSPEIIARGQNGRLIGGCVNPATGGLVTCTPISPGDGATTATIVFRSVVQNNFTNNYPSGDSSVDQGDKLINNAVVDGTTLNINTFTSQSPVESGAVTAKLALDRGGPLTKTVYTVRKSDGSTVVCGPGAVAPAPDPCPANIMIKPGDWVTYRLTYALPTSNVEALAFTDYLPLPIFPVQDPDGDGLAGPAWATDDVKSAVAPAPGRVIFGPADTFRAYSGIVPTITPDPVNNAITFSYGNYDNPADLPTVVDLLSTVAVATTPLADNLHVTNEVVATEGSTNAGPAETDAIATIILDFQTDLSISKTDGSPTYTPGTPISYTIVVGNSGPLDASGVSVADTLPATITGVTASCVAAGSASCGVNNTTGNNVLFPNASIAAGAANTLTFTVSGMVSASATGNLVNTATVTPGTGQTDSNAGNNSATDTDAPALQTDLSITKTDNSTTYTPGSPISYTLIVGNSGPSDATAVSVADTLPLTITGVTANCVAAGTANCGTNNTAGNNVSFTGVNINAGASNTLTFTVSGTVSASATGNLVNAATVIPGLGQTDLNASNNSAVDTDTLALQTDLSIVMTDGSTTYMPGNPISYTIVVGNSGPSNATGASMADTLPAMITGVTASCVASGTASCGTNHTTGNNVLFTGLNINAGAANTLTFLVNGTVSPSASGNLINTATVSPGPGQIDPTPANISATDVDTIQTAVVLPGTGFAPDRVTILPLQAIPYADLGDLWLEIPRLGTQMPIVGVPQVDGKWDVSWLGDSVGWLNGTSFPTWAGNSAITGHVYDADGQPGPFVHLNWLWYGDQIIVHAWGGRYVYEVRQVTQVDPESISSVTRHEELPWITLITCRGYDEASNSYKYRVVVRAVLVEVK